MKIQLKFHKIFYLFVIVIVIGKTTTIYSQTQGNTSSLASQNRDKTDNPIQKKVKENGDPIANYESLKDFNTPENSLRKIRNDKYNFKDAAVFNENSPSIFISGGFTHSPRKPAFPIIQSSYIVIGEISGKEAFLSTDKASVYSEFSFKIEEILKQNEEQPAFINNTITIERVGGKVRLPSGKLLHRVIEGSYLPQGRKRYLMFLKYDKETNSSYVLTGYELQAGKIVPLDGKGLETPAVKSYENYQQYNGIDETCFLNIVRNAILIN
jgi:hypothetical protein